MSAPAPPSFPPTRPHCPPSAPVAAGRRPTLGAALLGTGRHRLLDVVARHIDHAGGRAGGGRWGRGGGGAAGGT